jgi:DNA-directed RNA polymerase beta' subunit
MLTQTSISLSHSFAHTFRKEGHTKIVEYDLTPKQKALHDVAGHRRPDVLKATSKSHDERDSTGFAMEVDEDDDSSEEEADPQPEGDSNQVIVEMEAGAELPKAITGRTKTKRGRNERIVTPEEVREHLRYLFRNEHEMCSRLFGRHGVLTSLPQSSKATPHADMFFMEVIPVSPTRFRPPAKMGETVFEHHANELLTKILNTTYQLRDTTLLLREALQEKPDDSRSRLMARFFDGLIQLQVDVNSFLDSSKNPTPMRQGKLPPQGVKQVLEKKEGLFRKNMMVCFWSAIV